VSQDPSAAGARMRFPVLAHRLLHRGVAVELEVRSVPTSSSYSRCKLADRATKSWTEATLPGLEHRAVGVVLESDAPPSAAPL
jgi:hypothetical protein